MVGAVVLAMTACAKAAPLKIVAFGDSTTAPRAPDVKQVYAQVLAKELPRRGIEAEVTNAGVPGNHTVDAMKRLERDVLAKKPDLVIVQFGINDAAVDVWRKPPETKPRVAKDDYERNLRAMLKQIRAGGANVILMTPNPTRWTAKMREMYGHPPYKPDDPDGFNVLLAGYAEVVRRIAREEKLPLVDIYAAFNQHGQDKPGETIDDLLLDGTHPNDAGHKLVADKLIALIEKTIAKP